MWWNLFIAYLTHNGYVGSEGTECAAVIVSIDSPPALVLLEKLGGDR